MGFILTIVAYILLMVLAPIGLIIGVIRMEPRYFWHIAVSLDQLGNVICGPAMNFLLITSGSKHKFCKPDETISSVLGKNQRAKTLNRFGLALVKALDLLDENHSLKSIEDDE